MSRKIIIDCDPGIDDAIAVCMALFDPRVEVMALTATAGRIDANQSTTNIQALLSELDPPKYPRTGEAQAINNAPVDDDLELHGPDGLGGLNFESDSRQHRQSSEKVISELLRQHPGEITLVCLGPLSNIAKAFQRDPQLEEIVDRIIISGGSVAHGGNITPAAETNMYFDPKSAHEVFHSATTKSLVPLDVTEHVTFGLELVEQLPPRYSRAGALLHKLVNFLFRSQHQRFGREVIPLHDAVTMMAAINPDLFEWTEMAGDVQTQDGLARGATIFDRRHRRTWQYNMEVATDVDPSELSAQIIRGLRYAGQCT